MVAALAPAGLVSARAIAAYGGGFGKAFERVKKDWAVVTDLGSTTARGGYLERYLKLSFWASMIVGGSFAFSPLSPLAIVNEYTPSSQFIQRAFGLGTVFMLAPAQFVLLDAAKRGRLGGGTLKKLNLSIAVVAGIDFMTVYTFAAAQALSPDADALKEASGGIYNYVGALAVSFSILAVYLYQGLFAKKDADDGAPMVFVHPFHFRFHLSARTPRAVNIGNVGFETSLPFQKRLASPVGLRRSAFARTNFLAFRLSKSALSRTHRLARASGRRAPARRAAMSMLTFDRTDITQTAQAERGTMEVLPLSKGKRQNKIVLGDADGVVQALGMRKGEDTRSSVFKTRLGSDPIASLTLGAGKGQEDKIFVASGATVRGVNKKGKEFFKFSTNLTERIEDVRVDGVDMWATGEYFSNQFSDCADAHFFASNERIADARVAPVVLASEKNPISGLPRRFVRGKQGSELYYEAAAAERRRRAARLRAERRVAGSTGTRRRARRWIHERAGTAHSLRKTRSPPEL